MRTLTVGRGAILSPLIDEYQRREKFPPYWTVTIHNEKEWDEHFHPSSDVFTDPEMLFLEKTQTFKRRPISANLRRTFDVGHLFHGYIESILQDMGLVSPQNVEREILHAYVSPNGTHFFGKGTADLVDVNIPGHGLWLVDIKTMNSQTFGAPPDDLLKKYFAQVNCYGDWLGIQKMMILAICKDSPHDFREFIVPRDESVLQGIESRWSEAADLIYQAGESASSLALDQVE
jgi:hypothetical protein